MGASARTMTEADIQMVETVTHATIARGGMPPTREQIWTMRLIEATRAAQRDAAEMQAIFDLQWHRMQDATTRWQAAHPDRADVLPDLGDLLAWLLTFAPAADAPPVRSITDAEWEAMER